MPPSRPVSGARVGARMRPGYNTHSTCGAHVTSALLIERKTWPRCEIAKDMWKTFTCGFFGEMLASVMSLAGVIGAGTLYYWLEVRRRVLSAHTAGEDCRRALSARTVGERCRRAAADASRLGRSRSARRSRRARTVPPWSTASTTPSSPV